MFNAIEVSTSSQIQQWLSFQYEIYKNDPLYIAPIEKDVESLFHPESNAAFKDGKLLRYLFLNDQKQIIGRCAVFYREVKSGVRTGGMGYFECINDKEAAFYIFDTCKAWLQKNECTYMDGPINFGDRDIFWGLLIDIKTYPSFRESYNPKYYQAFFEDYGFKVEIEQSTQELTESTFNFPRFSKLADRVLSNPKYEFKYLDYSDADKLARDFTSIYNQAWSFHEDFKPLTVEEIKQRIKVLKAVSPPEISIFAYADGEPVAFYINVLEVNSVFKKFNGKLNLWNKLRFLMDRKSISKVRGLIFGVVPKYQNLGLETGLIMKFYETVKKYPRYNCAELAWIGDFNPKMLSMLSSLGAEQTKLHYTYRKIF